MKQWLLSTPLFQWAYKQGGIDSFPLAQKDILETMRDDLDKQSDVLAEQKLAALLSITDYTSVIKVEKGRIYIGGILAEPTRLANLKQEADFLLASDLWKVIHETIQDDAQKTMFVSSESLVDLQKGKSVLFTLSTQKRIIEFLQKLSPTL